MSIIQNPISDGGQAGRLDDLKQVYASGAISQEQYNDILSDEEGASKALTFKRTALGLLLATVGFFVLFSSF